MISTDRVESICMRSMMNYDAFNSNFHNELTSLQEHCSQKSTSLHRKGSMILVKCNRSSGFTAFLLIHDSLSTLAALGAAHHYTAKAGLGSLEAPSSTPGPSAVTGRGYE